MIIDSIDRVNRYFSQITKPQFNLFNESINSLNGLTPEGEYRISEKIILRIMSYSLKEDNDDTLILETHNDYIDIQTPLMGYEAYKLYQLNKLSIKEEYSAEIDRTTYLINKSELLNFKIEPGQFVVFFPHEPHLPQLQFAGEECYIKKAVYKIHKDLIGE